MKRVMLVFGTRPEAIKMCPLVLELKKRSKISTIVCVTAQHRQMLDGVLKFFGVVPDYDLGIMKECQDLFDITLSVLSGIRTVIKKEKPDVVLVHGDTSTSFVAALSCYYMHVPVGHVEAGLRTNDIYNPFPEEFNRQCVDIISKYNFAPTETAASNLLLEGKNEKTIYITGNTVIDSMKYTIRDDYHHPELDWVGDDKLILITAHRRENIGEPMRQMFKAIRRILEERIDCKAVFPIHLNPRVRAIANEELSGCERIHIIEPVDIIDCHNIEARSHLCLTDSGGIQEECTCLGVPVLVMRDKTERTEGIEEGTIFLVGTEEERIIKSCELILKDDKDYERKKNGRNPFGDGHACERIADVLEGKKYEPWRFC